MEGLDPAQRERLRFATRAIIEAISPSNFAFTNPEVIERTIETGGQNLVAGLEHMLTDLSRGQLTQTRADAFELGRKIGRAHVCTPVTNAHLVCRLLLEKKKYK